MFPILSEIPATSKSKVKGHHSPVHNPGYSNTEHAPHRVGRSLGERLQCETAQERSHRRSGRPENGLKSGKTEA